MVIAVRTERGPQCLEVVKAAGSEADQARLAHEAEVLRRAAHPGVVELLDATPTALHLRHSGTALARLGPLPPDNVAAVVRSVAETVAVLHQLNIAHRRITAEHVVIGERGRPRLCGFGSAGDSGPDDRADDVASLGRMLDELLDVAKDSLWTPAHRGLRQAGRRRRAMAAFRAAAAAAQRDDPGQRPTARQFASSLLDAFPDLVLPEADAEQARALPATLDPTADIGWTDQDLSFLSIQDESEEEWVTGQTPVIDGKAEVVVPSGKEWEDFVLDRYDDEPATEGSDEAAPAVEDVTAAAAPSEPVAPRVGPEPITIRAGIADRHARPAGGRRALVAVAAGVLVIGAVAGSVIAQAVRPFGSADPSGPSTATLMSESDQPAPEVAVPPTHPSTCVVPDVPGPDVDGDSCPDPVELEDRVAIVGTVRVELGQPGDEVALADSDCDGVATPAVLRPDTGEVFVFPEWDLDEPTEVGAATVVPGADRITAGDGECPAVIVTGDDGVRAVVAGSER
jgi:tRNA A-37 threonylcarbamoyl transferase component Bud32